MIFQRAVQSHVDKQRSQPTATSGVHDDSSEVSDSFLKLPVYTSTVLRTRVDRNLRGLTQK